MVAHRQLDTSRHGAASWTDTCRLSKAAPPEWRRAGRLSDAERASLHRLALRDIARPMLEAAFVTPGIRQGRGRGRHRLSILSDSGAPAVTARCALAQHAPTRGENPSLEQGGRACRWRGVC